MLNRKQSVFLLEISYFLYEFYRKIMPSLISFFLGTWQSENLKPSYNLLNLFDKWTCCPRFSRKETRNSK